MAHLIRGAVVPLLAEDALPAPELLRPLVAALLATGDEQIARLVIGEGDQDNKSRAQLRYLSAAYLRDVLGRSEEDVERELGYADPRSARRAVGIGRKLWSHLHAWPWYVVSLEGGAIPRNWWDLPEVSDAFVAWAVGQANRAAR